LKAQHQTVSFLVVLLLVLSTIAIMSEFFFARRPEFQEFKLEDRADAIASGLLISAQFSRGLELNQTGLSCDDPALPSERSSGCPGILWTNYSNPKGPVINPTPTEYGVVK
jgi:hypothetical protein